MKPLSQRTSQFTDSVIRRMSRVSNQYGAINLSQGFPDFDPPKALTNRLIDVAVEGPHQYATTWGAANFRTALAKKQSPLMGWTINPETEVVVTCGSTEAMMAAMMAVIDPGDSVAIFSPFYENYGADAILTGAKPIYIPLTPPAFTFNREDVEEAFKQGAKALILCNPSNPCGKVFTPEELKVIGELAIQYDAYVITDEVYEHIVYAPYVHTYMASLPNMRERTISCSSLSKTYSITGWRLGYVIGPEAVMERIKKVHDFLTVGAAAPLMEAAVAGLTMDDHYYETLTAHYTRKKELFLSGLDAIGLTYYEPQGAYYVMVDISEFQRENDVEFCERLAEKVGVAAVPGSSFFREDVDHMIRFHFAKKDDTLKKALEKLATIYDKMERKA